MPNNNLFTGPTYRMPSRGSGSGVDLKRIYRNAQTVEDINRYLALLSERGNQAGWLGRNTPGAYLPGVNGRGGEFVFDSTIDNIRAELQAKKAALLAQRDQAQAQGSIPAVQPTAEPTQVVTPATPATSNSGRSAGAGNSRGKSKASVPVVPVMPSWVNPSVGEPSIAVPSVAVPGQVIPWSSGLTPMTFDTTLRPQANIPESPFKGINHSLMPNTSMNAGTLPTVQQAWDSNPIRLPNGDILGSSSVNPNFNPNGEHPAFSVLRSNTNASNTNAGVNTNPDDSGAPGGSQTPLGGSQGGLFSGGVGKTLSGIGSFLGQNAGNLLSAYGTLMGSREQRRLIEQNRATDTPNINPYRDFGNRALAEIDQTRRFYDVERDRQLSNLDRQSAINNHNIGANNLSMSGVNSMRQAAFNDVMTNRQAIDSGYNQQVAGYHQQRAGQLNSMDQMYMHGEVARDLADRQDKDNYYSQLNNALQTSVSAMQTLGKDYNDWRANSKANELINQLSQYGFAIDAIGRIVKVQ